MEPIITLHGLMIAGTTDLDGSSYYIASFEALTSMMYFSIRGFYGDCNI